MSLTHEIDSIVANAISRRIFPGAVVLIARDDLVLHAAAYGTTMYDAPARARSTARRSTTSPR